MSHARKAYYLHQLLKQQWLKPSEIEKIQRKKLRRILKHAYENVPFYHHKFRSVGIMPEDIKSAEDLHKIPITTKQELKDNYPHGIVAKGVDLSRCWRPHTSGSTGIPLHIAYDTRDEDYEKATALRPNITCGQDIRDRWAVFTAPDHIVPKKWFQKIGVFSPDYISLFDDVDTQISQIEKINPNVIDGYASSIYLLAKRLQETGNCNINPKLIFSTSEILTEDMRTLIDSVFDVNVLDQFGCVELGRTAWECNEHMGYHIDSDSIIMEFIHDSSPVAPGERGEITYTGLYNYSMPLIRYAVGDIGIPSDEICSCGRGLPLMKLIEGRTDSFFQSPDKRVFSPITWTVIMRKIPGVGQFKAIQERKDYIRILVVRDRAFTEATAGRIVHDVQEVMGGGIHVDVEVVEEIPREKSGKVRCAVSRINIK